ncbi:hypothetical protein LXL04_039358 [Taraxacum kok-saghyz]
MEGDHQGYTQQDLVKWVDKTFDFKVSQGTKSNTLKRSSEFLLAKFDKDGSSKRHKAAKYLDMEKVVYEWFLQHQERKAVETMKLLYPQDSFEHKLSQGWLEKFKIRHGIKSYRRFGESGSVDTHDLENKLESIREKINQFPMKDVFNMDETGSLPLNQSVAAFEIVALATEGNEKLENGGMGWCARGGFVATSAPRSPRAITIFMLPLIPEVAKFPMSNLTQSLMIGKFLNISRPRDIAEATAACSLELLDE